ncbi:hypothetical protein LCGC14_2293740 [marine sediment metagenome]|uniref:Capsid protein n=1 Tax=marine sediment metagenome TaxID=412755 RepID=A0A0F9CQY9_9ZZZZ
MSYNTGSDPTLAELITAAFVPAKFSREVLEHTKSNLVVTDSFTHRFEKDLAFGYTVSIPVTSEITTTEVTPNTEPTAQDATGTPATITVDQWREATVEIPPLAKKEQLADYMAVGAKSASYAISKRIDTTVGALFSTLSSTSSQGADGQAFTDEIFRALVETLDTNDVPDDGRFLIGDPSMKSDLLAIDKFVRQDYINGSPTTNGRFGQLYGAVVKITNNLTSAGTGNYGVYAHPDAIGVVLQKNPNSNLYNLGWKFIVKIIVDAAWGYSEIRDLFGKAFYTRKNP